MMKPANTLFFSMVMMGTLISLSANSWFLAWFGLEMNLIGFVPLLISKENIQGPEAAIKYFFIQGASSSLLIISTLQISMNFSNSTLALLALMTKIGAAPCHFWVPSMLEAISWGNTWLLLTWQKVNPLFLITLSMKKLLVFFILMSLIFGTISGFNQTSTKKILAFSSISHLAWILTAAKISTKILSIYFTLYSATIVVLTVLMGQQNTNTINKTFLMDKAKKINLYLMMLSLGGMPPLLGFFPKIMVLAGVLMTSSVALPMGLILSSMVNLYFYLRMTYSALSVLSTNQQLPMSPSMNTPLILTLLGPLIPLI